MKNFGLVQLGRRPKANGLVDVLLECHGRIRSFAQMAERLAVQKEVSPAQVRDAAGQIYRYFSHALALHVRDEEDSILPRLREKDPSVDQALIVMQGEHKEHEAPLGRLLALCEQLQSKPELHPELVAELTGVASDLQRLFDIHLEREERVLFPALVLYLDGDAQTSILREIRARRGETT